MGSKALKKQAKVCAQRMQTWNKQAANKKKEPGSRAKRKQAKAMRQINELAQEHRPETEISIEEAISKIKGCPHGDKG